MLAQAAPIPIVLAGLGRAGELPDGWSDRRRARERDSDVQLLGRERGMSGVLYLGVLTALIYGAWTRGAFDLGLAVPGADRRHRAWVRRFVPGGILLPLAVVLIAIRLVSSLTPYAAHSLRRSSLRLGPVRPLRSDARALVAAGRLVVVRAAERSR